MTTSNNASPSGKSKGHRRVKSLVREWDLIKDGPEPPHLSINTTLGQNGSPSQRLRTISSSSERSTDNSVSPPDTGTEVLPSSSSTARISSAPMVNRKSKSGPSDGTKSKDSGAARAAYANRYAASGEFSPNGDSASDSAQEADIEAEVTSGNEDELEDVFLPLTPFANTSFNINPSAPSPSYPPLTENLPSSATAAERREHSRRHSRIHSRNLSVFFPSPGTNPTANGTPFSTSPAEDSNLLPSIEIPGASVKAGGAPYGGWSGPPSAVTTDSDSPSKSGRRGHHHRHSLSHNYFSFLDPTVPNGHLLPSPTRSTRKPSNPVTPSYESAAPHGAPSHLPGATPSLSLKARYSHLPLAIRLTLAICFHLPLRAQLALTIALLEIGLGAALWVTGQAGESLAVTGLGYLVVFDGIGALSAILIEGRATGIDVLWDVMGRGATQVAERPQRYPFGTHRLVTLSLFSQCVYLLFSAVYVCKESIEHVLLMHSPGEVPSFEAGDASHGAAHGSMGHGEGIGLSSVSADIRYEDVGIVIPSGLLLASAIICLITSLALRNHSSLCDAVESLSSPSPKHSKSPSVQRPTNAFLSLLQNPFSIATLIFTVGLFLASLVIPGVQLAPLDKVVALLESIAMFYIAYPAAEATGKILLQTAPSLEASAMTLMNRGIRNIEDHSQVSRVPPPHIWQLTPRDGLIVTLKVYARSSASDSELLELSQFAHDKCAPALVPNGELTVQVVRSAGNHHEHGEHDHSHKNHDHGHQNHSHEHSHAHSNHHHR